jgi:hypothetical protein
MSELPDEEQEALEDEKAKIIEEYEKVVSPKSLVYKEGSTQGLMRAACRELTALVSQLIYYRHYIYIGIQAVHFDMGNVAVGGWIISLDPHDPTASACNMMFCGSDALKKYLTKRKVDMHALMYDIETVCRWVLLRNIIK